METDWELGVSRNLLNVRYDDASKILFVDTSYRRKDVTSARGALNGYQKGKLTGSPAHSIEVMDDFKKQG